MWTEILKAIVYGILEGITEWLPVSSTGHLILLDELLSLRVAPALGETFAQEYWKMFEVVIQLGAILAVVVMFFRRLNPFSGSKSAEEKKSTWQLWLRVCVASIPAAVLGIFGDKLLFRLTGRDLDGWLYRWGVVAGALILYGILFLVVEKLHRGGEEVTRPEGISCRRAMQIGCFQALSIVPGTSRSGSTILGARTLGVSRSAAAEFSFFMGIPAMLGASLIRGVGFFRYLSGAGISVPATAWLVLLTASATAFLVSLATIRFLMDFVRRHSFAPFGIYRILLGVAMILWFSVR